MKVPSIEPVLLFSLIAICLLLAGFWEFADDVMEGDTHEFDRAVLLAMRNASDTNMGWGPAWFSEMMRDISGLGSTFTIALFTLSAALYFFITRNIPRAIYVVAAVATGIIVSNAMKLGFDRPRPDLVPHATQTMTSSFPSSHSMMSVIAYLILGTLIAQAQPTRKLKIFFIGVAALIAFTVGISRIYLGVHWPSDVLAGWIAGLIWASLFWTAQYYYLKRKKRHGPA